MSNEFPHEDDDDFIESKSARKRQMHALQSLGEQLVDLSPAQLQKLNIQNEALLEAVLLAQRISHRSGKRRQMQFIGKLMRSADADSIAEALTALHETSRKVKTRERLVEGARDALLAGGDEALGEVLSIWPDADRHLLRQMMRSAEQEKDQKLSPSSSRKLFRYLRSLSDPSVND
jgi:ribosome-associated protein